VGAIIHSAEPEGQELSYCQGGSRAGFLTSFCVVSC